MAPPTTMDDSARTHANGGPRDAASAGALLRTAREKQGMHIATLAAAIKVAPRKLDALEHDRWDELPGPTFTRALAQAVCRALKTDPQPIMELLPPADTSMLDSTFGTINEPFAGAGRESGMLQWLPRGPWLIAAIALVLAAALVMWMPAGSWSRLLASGGVTTGVNESTAPIGNAPAAAAPATAGAAAGAGPTPSTMTASSASPVAPPSSLSPAAGASPGATLGAGATSPAPPAAAAPQLPAAPGTAAAANAAGPVPAGALVVACAARSWIEVVDARGRVLVSRNLESGETMGLDGLAPLQLVVGNASSTQVTYKGAAVEILSRARDNVARFELK